MNRLVPTWFNELFSPFSSLPIQFFLYGLHEAVSPRTSRPSSLQERGRDCRLRAVLCYKRLFTKVTCMGCKRSFLKVSLLRKAVYIPYKPLQITVCNNTPLASKSHVRVPVVSLGGLCLSPQGAGKVSCIRWLPISTTRVTLKSPPYIKYRICSVYKDAGAQLVFDCFWAKTHLLGPPQRNWYKK